MAELYAEEGSAEWAKNMLKANMEARGLIYEDPDG